MVAGGQQRCFLSSVIAVLLHVSSGAHVYDVLVYGATPGGVAAAVAAARENATVALVEPSQYIGGMYSGGLGTADVGVHPDVSMGLSFEFFQRIAVKYSLNGTVKPLPFGACDPSPLKPPFRWEPHVGEAVLQDMITDANSSGGVLDVFMTTRILAVTTNATNAMSSPATAITSVSTNTTAAPVLYAKQFVDGSYEGWLMRLTPGVSWTFGRESADEYGESVAGVLPVPTPTGVPYGHTHHFEVSVSPYTDGTNTTCLPHVNCDPVGPTGSADWKTGAYDWRMCLTTDPANMLPLPTPEAYDPAEFEIIRRIIRARNETGHPTGWGVPKPNIPAVAGPATKTDWKIGGPGGFTGEYVGGSWKYPNATWDEQRAIVEEHKRFAIALLHFWRTDPAVPLAQRAELAPGKIGLPKDEFERSGHWSPQLYIREAARLKGQYVLTQHDILINSTKWDVVGLGSYSIDIPGAVDRIPAHGKTLLEGGMQSPSLCNHDVPAYAIPLRSLRPKVSEASNLFVPVALSSSHVAFNSVRMEPTWMVLGQSAGIAASMGAASRTGEVNVTALQDRLLAVGQVLTPRSTAGHRRERVGGI